GFKRAFATLSGKDIETFTGTMFLNVEQLEKQLDKEDFQEIGSMDAFNVLEAQFQMFITSRVYLNDEYVAMTHSVKKSIDARAQHKREYDSWDTSSISENDARDDGVNIRPIYNEEPMAKQCVFSANHDSCLTKLLNEVNSRAKVPSNKTPERYKPVEQISVPKKQERKIQMGHRFSIQRTYVVQKKTMTPIYCLRWQPTGRIFNTVGLRWVPTGKILASSTTKVDSEPLNGSNADIANQYECKQTLDVIA
nr:hypothetical protein [Tanacetum cinerariifolium]